MQSRKRTVSRRTVLWGSAAASSAFAIVPPHVLGGPGRTPPSETVGGALIGCGGRGPGTVKGFGDLNAAMVACCDVNRDRAYRYAARHDGKCTPYIDFRRMLERKDTDVVAIATPPHWHALISIACMEAGKDVLCEKPMTRFIAEGRAVIAAAERYGRIFQIGTFGRFGRSKNKSSILLRKIMKSGLLKNCEGVHIKKGGLKVKEWSGLVNTKPRPVPENLDWDLYQGPAPMKPYHPHRFGGTHRGYWDYEGGGLSDMGQHHFDPFTWEYGKDDTAPVEIEAHAPPAHPEAVGMWGWVEMKYADGFTVVMDSTEWGKPYDRKEPRSIRMLDLSEEDREKVKAMPDSEPLLSFAEAVRTRKPAGGNANVSHRTATILHLANLAIRVGRKIRFDPDTDQILGDPEANRLVNQPMRAPWHL